MRKLEINEMVQIEGGNAPLGFKIECAILTAALATITFGVGLAAAVACVALSIK
jgi:hypothetical protein